MADDPLSIAEILLREEATDRTCTLENGIVLHVKKIGQGILGRAIGGLAKPEPPVHEITDPDTGNVEKMPWPDDPDYQAALEAYDTEVLGAALRVMKRLGTRCKSVPAGMYRPEEDGWVEELDAAGIVPDLSTEAKRYGEWLDLYASNPDDNRRLSMATLLANGITEPEVADAVARFQSRAVGGADNGVPDEGGDRDGDNDRAADPGDGA